MGTVLIVTWYNFTKEYFFIWLCWVSVAACEVFAAAQGLP